MNCSTWNTIGDTVARAKKLPLQKKPEFSIHSISLTPDVVEALDQLSRDASDFIGRSISYSAVVRAVIREVVKQGPAARDALFVQVEKELRAGVKWGKQV